MIKTYATKSKEIQAIQYTGDNFDEIKRFVNTARDFLLVFSLYNPPDIYIDFGGYCTFVKYGDYVFKNGFGKIVVVCKNEFENIYKPKE